MSSSTTEYPLPNTQYPDSPPPPIENQNSKIENPPAPLPDPESRTPDPALSVAQHPLCPPGSLTLLLGEPGTGKSLLALDLAARLSRGLPLPSFTTDHEPLTTDPASAVILSREDTLDTLHSRLAAANANFNYITLPNRFLSLAPDPSLEFPNGPVIPSTLTQYLILHLKKLPNLKLLILDPLPPFLGNADINSANRLRSLIDPLLLIAATQNLAILAISHLNKSHHHKLLLHRAYGSHAYPALARAVYYLLRDPTPSNQAQGLLSLGTPRSRRLLLPGKANLAPDNTALAFHITPNATLAWEPNPIANHPLLDSQLFVSHSALSDPFAKSQLDFACDFLQQSLQSGPIPSKELLKEARTVGISSRTLERRRYQLGATCRKDHKAQQWLIHPPTPPNPTPLTFT